MRLQHLMRRGDQDKGKSNVDDGKLVEDTTKRKGQSLP